LWEATGSVENLFASLIRWRGGVRSRVRGTHK
jgi:hypothetical protein